MAESISANGIRVSYRIEGPAGAPCIMLSNSLLTDSGMWDPQVPELTRRYRLLRYDTRGHGGTQATAGPYSMELLAADALGLLDALEIRQVHFVGLSMGGMIAQLLAGKHGGRLLSVSLCDTACRLPPESAWDERIAMAQSKGTAAFMQPMTSRWLTASYRERHPGVVEKLGAMIARTSVEGMVGCCHAIKKMDHSPVLPGIKVPALVVVGEHDVGTPVAAAETLHQAIKGSELVVVKNAGHLPNIEQTEIFNRTLTNFLARV